MEQAAPKTKKKKYVAKLDGVVIGTRASHRAYAQAVAVRPSYEAAIAAAIESANICCSKENYEYWSRYAGLSRAECEAKVRAKCVGRDAWRLNGELLALDHDMAECAEYVRKYPSAEARVAAAKQENLGQVEAKKQAGHYDQWAVHNWCGRPDLAQKEAAKLRNAKWVADVRIVPAEAA